MEELATNGERAAHVTLWFYYKLPREHFVAVGVRAIVTHRVEEIALEHLVPNCVVRPHPIPQHRVRQGREWSIPMMLLPGLDERRVFDGVVGAVKDGAWKVARIAGRRVQGIGMKEAGVARLQFHGNERQLP